MLGRSRVLVCGVLACALFAAPSVSAAPNETTKCSTTVCAVAGATVSITCARPDAQTVECQGVGTVWGSGRSSAAIGLPGALTWRAEGRCGASCTSNQLQTGSDAWDGVRKRSAALSGIIRFPKVKLSSSSRVCITYTAGVASYSEATTATVSFSVDRAEASRAAYAEVVGFCNQV